ncbi:MAG: glycine cleavage T C-terminal barrel domain-containing protein [Sedimentisphaerales bacterium]|nr:glycine cleavage T C-terminal barrel domain-containing protein [Sedimentisphaerales bacterium]
MSIKSPFNSLHTDLKANFADYCGWSLPSDYGDSDAECRQLYEHCAAFDLSAFGRISVGGEEAHSVVSYLLANSDEKLDDGKWIWGVVCDDGGKLIDIVRVGQAGSAFLLLTSPGARQHVAARVAECARQCGAAEVKINDQTEKTGMLGIYGPGAVEAFDHIVPLGIAQMEPQSVKNLSIFMMSITVIRGGWLGVDGIEIFGGATACKLAAGAIEKYHKREHITPAGMECLEIAATEASLPLIVTGQELPQRFVWPTTATPHDAGRVLVGIRSDGKAHTHKDMKVQYDGLEIGWTDRIVWSQRFGKTVGLAMVDSEMGDLTEGVQIIGDGITMGAEIVQLPFEKEIAAGIYKD